MKIALYPNVQKNYVTLPHSKKIINNLQNFNNTLSRYPNKPQPKNQLNKYRHNRIYFNVNKVQTNKKQKKSIRFTITETCLSTCVSKCRRPQIFMNVNPSRRLNACKRDWKREPSTHTSSSQSEHRHSRYRR
jgi:hypothetical protein